MAQDLETTVLLFSLLSNLFQSYCTLGMMIMMMWWWPWWYGVCVFFIQSPCTLKSTYTTQILREGPIHIRNEPVTLGPNNNSIYVYNLYN